MQPQKIKSQCIHKCISARSRNFKILRKIFRANTMHRKVIELLMGLERKKMAYEVHSFRFMAYEPITKNIEQAQ